MNVTPIVCTSHVRRHKRLYGLGAIRVARFFASYATLFLARLSCATRFWQRMPVSSNNDFPRRDSLTTEESVMSSSRFRLSDNSEKRTLVESSMIIVLEKGFTRELFTIRSHLNGSPAFSIFLISTFIIATFISYYSTVIGKYQVVQQMLSSASETNILS